MFADIPVETPPLFTDADLRQLYERLAEVYPITFDDDLCGRHNPIKSQFVIRHSPAGAVEQFVNVMSAMLPGGAVCCKIAGRTEATGEVYHRSIHFPTAGPPSVWDGYPLTKTRCGLMAAYATRLFLDLRPDDPVGLIGLGRINRETARVYHALFGTTEFVVKGSRHNPTPDPRHLPAGVNVIYDAGDDLAVLRACPVVISCTNAIDKADALRFDQLSGPRLFIAQDSGYIFGPSFRSQTISYSDHPAQLLTHWRDEFPWDAWEEPIRLWPLTMARRGLRKPVAVYLYGIALADAVMTEFLHERYCR